MEISPPNPEPAPPQTPRPSKPRLSAGALVALAAVGLAALVLAWPGWLGGAFLAAPAPTATPDAFRVVRAEAQAAFERGQRDFERGEFERALIEFDRARVNDPDNRADIKRMLASALDELRKQESPTQPSPTAGRSATPTPYTVFLPAPKPRPPAPATSTSTPVSSPRPTTQMYTDQEQRFSLNFPADWRVSQKPPAEAGAGVVSFHPPSGRASFVVSVDLLRQPVSPELYSAHLETSLGTLPGYSLEDAAPALVSATPAWRRLYSIKREGQNEALRTLQVVLARRSTVYILTGTAPASEFAGSSARFDQMVKSFELIP